MVPPAENGAFFVTTNLLVTSNQTWGRCPEVELRFYSSLCSQNLAAKIWQPKLGGQIFAFFSLKIFLTNMNACLRTPMRCQQPDVGWINDILIPQPNAPLAKAFPKVGNQVITLIWSEELGLSGNQPDQSFY